MKKWFAVWGVAWRPVVFSEEAIAASMGDVESEIAEEIVTEVEGGAGTTEA